MARRRTGRFAFLALAAAVLAASACTPSPAEPPPVISGDVQVGSTLSASVGAWLFDPADFSFQWKSCDAAAPTSCVDVGDDSSSYEIQPSDLGRMITVVVTATNPAGSGDRAAVAVGPVEPAVDPTDSYAGVWTATGTRSLCGVLGGVQVCGESGPVTLVFTLDGPCDGEGWCRNTPGSGWNWNYLEGSGCLAIAPGGYGSSITPVNLRLTLGNDAEGQRIDVRSVVGQTLDPPTALIDEAVARRSGTAPGGPVSCVG